ncbi:MAG TPA: YwaF family protein [Bacillota bacterium]|nr:YwaF family protein [Bacillota bacterium]
MPDDYNFSHVVILIIPVLFIIGSYLALKKEDQDSKNFFITFIAFAGFIQYFAMPRYGLGGLPLHLCNMAIILMMASAIFKWKGFFYFNYFANVLGALAALLIPDITDDLFNMGEMRYAFNHWYAFAWPILAVALGTFRRPQLKDMYKALGVFSVYYLIIVFLNAWFNTI